MIDGDITEEELMRLAHGMVAAGNLSSIYGLDKFVKAESAFKSALRSYTASKQKDRPITDDDREVIIGEPLPEIPELLKPRKR